MQMLILESKLKGKDSQFALVDKFVRNTALRFCMDRHGKSQSDLSRYCAGLAKQFEWASQPNSQAQQASAARARFASPLDNESCAKPAISCNQASPSL
jgi:hypothetical protein